MSLIGNVIDLGWCGFSGKSPVDEELFAESTDVILKNYSFFLRLYFVDGEIQFVFLCMMIQIETQGPLVTYHVVIDVDAFSDLLNAV